MDFHEDLKLPAEAIVQIADDARNAKAEFGVSQIELYHNTDGKGFCLLDGLDEEAIRRHHVLFGGGAVRRVRSTTGTRAGRPMTPGGVHL
jgi:hypothetical protein